MALWSAAQLWEWWRLKRARVWLPSSRQAAFCGLVLTTLQKRNACNKMQEADDPRHALQENGGVADLWYMDDGDILCHPVLVPRAKSAENRGYLRRGRLGCSSV